MFNNKKVFLIAEAGNNHEGSFQVAKKLILEAKKSGADAIKFQTFIPELFVSSREKKRFNILNKFKLSFEQFRKLAEYAKLKNIIFFSTPLDQRSAFFLNRIQKIFKIASSDSNFSLLLKQISGFNKDIILSTGMTDINTIKVSKKSIFNYWKKNKKKKKNKLCLMHCVSSYPVPYNEANLNAIKTLSKNFKDCVIGYSDHTIGNQAALGAVALGAKVVEKHFTLSKNFSKFRDHKLSATPKEFRELANDIRKLESMLGDGQKNTIQNSEKKSSNYMRRGAVASKIINKDKKIQLSDIKWIRIKGGLKINYLNKIINKKAKKKIKEEDKINLNHIY